DLLHGGDHLALGGAGAGGLDDRRHQVLGGGGGPFELGQGGLDGPGVAGGPGLLQALDLAALHGGAVGHALGLGLVVFGEVVDADHDPLAAVELALVGEGGVGDLALGEVGADRLDHAAELVDAGEVVIGGGLDLVGEALHEVGAAERVGGVG